MPYGDGTGPAGRGPRTGRGLGYCSGRGAPGYTYPGPGMGRGWGRGRGFWGPAPYAPAQPPELTKDQQVKILENEKKAMESELESIKKRLKELE